MVRGVVFEEAAGELCTDCRPALADKRQVGNFPLWDSSAEPAVTSWSDSAEPLSLQICLPCGRLKFHLAAKYTHNKQRFGGR